MISRTILLDGGDALLGLLDAEAGRGPDVHLEGAGVDLGEELLAEHGPEEDDRQRQEAEADGHGLEPVPQDDVECPDIVVDARLDHPLPAAEGTLEEVPRARRADLRRSGRVAELIDARREAVAVARSCVTPWPGVAVGRRAASASRHCKSAPGSAPGSRRRSSRRPRPWPSA